jgi:CheY-like chemotaxis protein
MRLKAEQGKMMTELKIALIVSDDEAIRKRFSRLLSQIRAPYLLESDRPTAVARLIDLSVRVLIVDMLSNKEDDLDFLKIVKKLRPRVPIIAITDQIGEEARNRILEEGAKYCLIKSMKDQEVSEMVNAMMESE